MSKLVIVLNMVVSMLQAPDLKGAAKDVKGKVESATPSFSNPFKGFGGGGGLPGSNVDTSISTKPL
jgi:hypothetical protein